MEAVVQMRSGAATGRFPVSLSADSLFHPHRHVMDDPDQNSSHFIHSPPNASSAIEGNCERNPALLFAISRLPKRKLVFRLLEELS